MTHPVAARQQSSQFESDDVHGSLSVPAVVQNVWPVRFGHAIVPQLVRSLSATPHSTSHAHEFEQVMIPHAAVPPRHATSQRP